MHVFGWSWIVLIWTTFAFNKNFPDRIISRDDRNWPMRSCYLTPYHFFLWGQVKDKVYIKGPKSTQDLKDGIREAIEGIQQPQGNFVMENCIQKDTIL